MSTTFKAFETISLSEKTVAPPWWSLSLLSIALAYAIYSYGGVVLFDWNICLLVIGLAAVLYWLRNRVTSRPLQLILAGYVCLQLLPLPMFLLQLISPARAGALRSMSTLTNISLFEPLSITPATTFVHLLRALAYLLTFLLIRDISRRASTSYPWLAVFPLIAIAAIEAVIGLVQSAQSGDGHGTYANRNHFAGLLEMILPLALAYALSLFAKRPLKACAFLSGAVLIFAGLLASTSKMGFAAGLLSLYAVALLVIAVRVRGWKKWAVVAGLSLFFVFAFLFLPSDALLGKFEGLSTEDHFSAEGRWPIWLDTIRLVAAYPLFGCGLGNFETAFLKYQTSVVDATFSFAHNDYLQILAELGLLGFVLMAALALPILTRTVRSALRPPTHDTRYLAVGCTGAFVAIGLHSLSDFNLYIPANALLLAWIAGIAAALLPANDTRLGPFSRRIPIALGGLLLLYAPAWLLFGTAFRSDADAERWFCRFGICDTGAVMAAQILGHGGEVANVPVPALLTALRREPNAPDRWCDLGDAMLHTGRLADAGYCFRTALQLAPDIPPVQMRAADYYYRLHQAGRALEQRARILKNTYTYDALTFDWYAQKKIPVSMILAHGFPQSTHLAQSYLRYLMAGDSVTDAAEAWAWALSHHLADAPLARDYTGFLLAHHLYETAAHSWADYLGPRRDGYLQSNWLYNGDFEYPPSGSPFDWSIESTDDVEAALDSHTAHTGQFSLRIAFQGQENINFHHVSQTVFVTPGKYRLEAYVRSDGITTDQGLAFHIYDAESSSRLDIKTSQITGTTGWRKVEQTFVVPPTSHLLQIQLIREPSLRFDNAIKGTVWIDSITLVQ